MKTITTLKTRDFLEIGLVIILMVIVGKLAYQEGEYNGMKEICKDKRIYIENDEFVCLGENVVNNMKEQMDIGIGATSPEIKFNVGEI